MEMEYSRCRQKAPGYLLAVLHRLSAAFLTPHMQALGLRRGGVGVLLETIEHPGQTQDALSRSLRVDPAATARALFELENQGYVERREDPADRRQKRVFPTAKTTEMADRFFAVLATHNQALFQGFDAAQREEALALLDAMIANLETALRQNA
jgi:DNA-binding MarR family transcriptional regulator